LKVDYLNKTVANVAIVCSSLLLESNRFEKAREGFLDIVQRLDVGSCRHVGHLVMLGGGLEDCGEPGFELRRTAWESSPKDRLDELLRV